MTRILFVDDEQNVLDGLRRMLHSVRDRWEMEFVSSGKAALLACSERSFDVVVSDLRMPGMDGAELLEQVRGQFPASARIVLSGSSGPALSARADLVAHRVLRKPCNAGQVKAAIELVCNLQDSVRSPTSSIV